MLKFGNTGRELREGQGCLLLGTGFTPLLTNFLAAVRGPDPCCHCRPPAPPRPGLAHGLRTPVPLPRVRSSLRGLGQCPSSQPFAPGLRKVPPLAPPRHPSTCSFPSAAWGGSWDGCPAPPCAAASHGPCEGLLSTLEICGRAETPFKQQALPDGVHRHWGGSKLARGQGKSSPRVGFSSFSVAPPRFCESKWLGKQYFKILAPVAHKDVKGCQKARFRLGSKTGTAAACQLCNINRGALRGLRRKPLLGLLTSNSEC